MPLLLERTLDVSEDVRAAVFARMHAMGVDLDTIRCVLAQHCPTMSYAHCRVDMRPRLLLRGLRDRSSSVQQAAAALATAWMEACGGPVHLLQRLDAQRGVD